MDIISLEPGRTAPIDSDCISIAELPDGRYSLTGSLLTREESVAMVGGPTYDSPQAAEDEGTAWAAANGIELLYVSRTGP